MTGYRRYWEVRKKMIEKYASQQEASAALSLAARENPAEEWVLFNNPVGGEWWVMDLRGYKAAMREGLDARARLVFRGDWASLRILARGVPHEIF